MSLNRIFGLVAVGGLLAASFSGNAFAAQGTTYQGTMRYQAEQAGPKCPGIGYHLTSAPGQSPVGFAWFRDLSGISKFSGTSDPKTGAFHLTLAPIDGDGPTGTVEGARHPDGSMLAKLTGPGCSNGMFMREHPENEGGDEK